MPNYLEVISECFPDAEAYTAGDPTVYGNIVWVTTPIAQATLDVAYLAQLKTDKIIELSVAAEDEIVNGFPSLALGTEHWYDSEPEDQLNLIGSVASGDDMYYSCRETQTGPKTYQLHTHAQLVQVLQSGRDIKLAVLQRFSNKRDETLAAITEQEIMAITWYGSP